MYFVKYYTYGTFRKETFVCMLEKQLNVRAKVVEDGIILDRDAFNSWSAGELPVWAFVNRQDINSPLHTRPAKPEEWPDITPKSRYQIAIKWEDDGALEAGKVPGKSGALRLAQDLADSIRGEKGFISVLLIDMESHKILHEYK